MRVLIATSELTYVPGNGRAFFDVLMDRVPEHLAGLVIVRGLSTRILGSVVGLHTIGARRMSTTVARNIGLSFQRQRERLFRGRGLPVFRTDTVNDSNLVDRVRKARIDLMVNARTRCIYKSAILEAPRLGCLNIHHGLLPDDRSLHCDLYAMHDGRPAGFTIHEMVARVDAGRILVRRESPARAGQDYAGYLLRSSVREAEALADLIDRTARTDALPGGAPNLPHRLRYTRSPSLRTVRRLVQDGVRL